MGRNQELMRARATKKDEFYTQYEDIAKEIPHYAAAFRGKRVLCNCDDPAWSQFWRYFQEEFHTLGLKALTATHFSPAGGVFVSELTETGLTRRPLQGDGDFRSNECLEILEQADIVCSNPPFSLFREYLLLLNERKKDFLILGNMNSASCKEVFPLFQQGRVWYGVSILSGDREFRVPEDYPLAAAGCRTGEDGAHYIRVKGVRWFTNLTADIRRPPVLPCDKDGETYPRYLNFDAIEVGSVRNIPRGYRGNMGVSITFLDKEYSEEYEIMGSSATLAGPVVIQGREKANPQRFYLPSDAGPRRLYERIVIRAKGGD